MNARRRQQPLPRAHLRRVIPGCVARQLRLPFDPDRLDRRDPALIEACLPFVRQLASRYFRLDARGFEHLPAGPAIYVANHNGGIAGPDLLCTLGCLWNARGSGAPLYALAHDFAMRHLTPLGRVVQAFGAVRASSTNAHRVLSRGGQLLVYPGGDLDAYRHWRQRNDVVFGGRTGFARLARDAGVPIVPIVAAGAHASAYIFSEGESLARWTGVQRRLRIQRFPLALALPWGIAAGPWLPYLPLPLPIRLRVLEPIEVRAEEQDLTVAAERVRSAMQRRLRALSRAASDRPRRAVRGRHR